MPGHAPKTANWTARENRDNNSTVLIVTGQVEVDDTNQQPVLTEAAAGGNKQLTLDLALPPPQEKGEAIRVPVRARFSKDVKDDQINAVVIRFDGKPIGRAKVVDDEQHGQRLTVQTRAANAEAAESRAEGALQKAKKAVAKAKKRVKKVAKRVKKTIKRAAKAARAAARVTRKGAKKKAKKTVKKTKKVARKTKGKARGRKKRL